MKELYFTENRLADLQPQHESGLYVTISQPQDKMPAGTVGPDNTPVVWRAAPLDMLTDVAMLIHEQVRPAHAITLHPEEEPLADTRLAVAFGAHLYRKRFFDAKEAQRLYPCVTAATPPQAPPAYVRIPHLVATDKDTVVHDTVIWEMFTRSGAEEWLGKDLPDADLIESNLPTLLALRQAVRTDTLPDTPDHRSLSRLLDTGRYISMLLVYQNPELFYSLFQTTGALREQQTQDSPTTQDK